MSRNKHLKNKRVNRWERIAELPADKKVKKTIGEQLIEWVEQVMPNRF